MPYLRVWRPLILTKHAGSFRNSIMGGGSNVEGESLPCQLHFQSARKTKKNASAQGSLKFREVSNGFQEGTKREKTRLKKVSFLLTHLLTYLVS